MGKCEVVYDLYLPGNRHVRSTPVRRGVALQGTDLYVEVDKMDRWACLSAAALVRLASFG